MHNSIMTSGQRAQAVTAVPLVVDLDGTLIKVDSLHEAFVQLSASKPLQALRALLMLGHGRAAFKAVIADHMLPDGETVPVNEAVLEVAKQAKSEGRKVYLATAADRRFAEAISGVVGLFDGVFASEHGINLKGKAKADRLVDAFGVHGFDYMGNDTSDIPVWRIARIALVSGAAPRAAKQIIREVPGAVGIGTREFAPRRYLAALRPHQWLKNALVALPAIAGHDFSTGELITVLLAFMSFSFGASSVYLVNDMIDLPHDRAHPEKRHRSLAAGAIPLDRAAVLLALVATLSIGAALVLPRPFMIVLIVYFGLSMSYSLFLKRKLMIDVVTLAMLYGIRVFAGAAATAIAVSHWLIGFCFFIFLSLALTKRTAEMLALAPAHSGKIRGRAYRRTDIQTMAALTGAASFVAVLVLALYINSPEVRVLYRHPELLWGICLILVYWLGRVCFLTSRGEMRQDPVIFAATDWVSLVTGVLVIGVFLAAI